MAGALGSGAGAEVQVLPWRFQVRRGRGGVASGRVSSCGCGEGFGAGSSVLVATGSCVTVLVGRSMSSNVRRVDELRARSTGPVPIWPVGGERYCGLIGVRATIRIGIDSERTSGSPVMETAVSGR